MTDDETDETSVEAPTQTQAEDFRQAEEAAQKAAADVNFAHDVVASFTFHLQKAKDEEHEQADIAKLEKELQDAHVAVRKAVEIADRAVRDRDAKRPKAVKMETEDTDGGAVGGGRGIGGAAGTGAGSGESAERARIVTPQDQHGPHLDQDFDVTLDHFAAIHEVALALLTSQSESLQGLRIENTALINELKSIAQHYNIDIREKTTHETVEMYAHSIGDAIRAQYDSLVRQQQADSQRLRELEAQKGSAESQLAISQASLRTEQAQVQSLTTDTEKLQSDKTELERERDNLESRNSELETRIQQLDAKLQAKTQELAKSQGHVASYQTRVADLERTITGLQADIQRLETTQEKSSEQISALVRLKEESQAALASLEDKIRWMKDQLKRRLKNKIDRLHETVRATGIILNNTQQRKIQDAMTYATAS